MYMRGKTVALRRPSNQDEVKVLYVKLNMKYIYKSQKVEKNDSFRYLVFIKRLRKGARFHDSLRRIHFISTTFSRSSCDRWKRSLTCLE